MPTLNPDHVAAVREIINRGPYFRHLSMDVVEMGPGHSIVHVKVGREHLNPFGGLHGGVYASAIDTAAYWSVYCDLPEGAGLISVDLKVDFLAPINEGTIVVRGRRIKTGRTMCLAEGTAFDRDERLLAHGLSKMIVTRELQVIRNVVDFVGEVHLPPKFI